MQNIVKPTYQPVRDLLTGDLLYFEALARVAGPKRNAHTELLRLGEEAGFIDEIDIAMLGHAAQALALNQRAVVAVNVSGRTIDYSTKELLGAVFHHMNVMPRMVFEFTETVEIRNLDMLDLFLRSVRMLGARVAADDFGTGHCTENFVELTRPDYVKLAGTVVADLAAGGDVAVLKGLRTRMRAWDGKFIAEYVDSPEKAHLMRRLGVRYGQGFYIGDYVNHGKGLDAHVGSPFSLAPARALEHEAG